MPTSEDVLPFAHEPLRRWEKWGLAGLLLVIIGFGYDTEMRSAFYRTRMTDVGCYFRAGWAIRAGEDIFEVQDDNWWHYAYSPAFAVAMVPLADAPAGHPRNFMLPYPISVAIWFVFSVFCIALAIHWFARTLEATSNDPLIRALPFGCRRWWTNRTIAFFVCIVPLGATLQRGQVNALVLLLVAGLFRATVRQRRFASGLWLTAAICVKIIPAFLVLYPVWRRDTRALGGLLAGLLIAIVIIPVSVWGVSESVALHKKLAVDILFPGALGSGNKKRDEELLKMTATANHSIQAAAHNLQYWDIMPRPPWASTQTKIIHLTLSLLLTGACLGFHGWRRNDDPVHTLLFLGALLAVMLACSPISHPHYFCFLIPLIMALQAVERRQRPDRAWLSPRLSVSLALTAIIFAFTDLPIWLPRQQAGLSLVSVILLLPQAFYYLHQGKQKMSQAPAMDAPAAAAA
jgi:alpha-1,2-mannosyltransferase